MRVAIITESFAPDLNGVAHSVVRVAEHLRARGHQPLVIAPEPAASLRGELSLGYPVVRIPSLPLPGYPTFRIGLPSRKIVQTLSRFAPDVVHLASPFALGAYGLAAADTLGIPTVAVYQTDVPRFAAGYGLGFARAAAWRWVRRIHNAAARTLAPSTAAIHDLAGHGVERIHLWRRGVDTVRFDPAHRDDEVRARLAPAGGVIVGYVGRLAPEKQLALLRPVAALSGIRLVLVGDGPDRAVLERLLPAAIFLGEQRGHDLAKLYASFDVFVHTGPFETFCQTIQEAQASGVAVVAPDRGGPRDLVTPGSTGLLVAPGDGDGFAAAVRQLVTDEPMRTPRRQDRPPSRPGA